MFNSILLVYYHPVVFDLAVSFRRIFTSVEMCVTQDLVDNYGTQKDVIHRAESLGIKCQTINSSLLLKLKSKKYDFVGLDGVFQGDNLVIDICKASKIPYFAISGYPHTLDEPAQNILSFSWYMPQAQYRKKYPYEAGVKNENWREISANGSDSSGKNFFVFYPEFRELKDKISEIYDKNDRNFAFLSLIHRFKECNEHCFAVFDQVQRSLEDHQIELKNFSSLTQDQVWTKIFKSSGLIHLKHGDCPGISVLESMILGRVPVIMRDFVLASQNQEVLIDNHSAIVCDSVKEMKERSLAHWHETKKCGNNYTKLETSTFRHAMMITDFERQKSGLIKFFNRCLERT